MSRSNPTVQNPCTKFIDYHGDDGTFTYYDKESEEKVQIDTPIYFAVLDELSTITGFNEKHGCGIYSNEVNSLTHEILRVKTFKGGESVIGLYKDIKDNIKAMGGKFTKSVYALLIHEDQSTEFVNFKFKGAAFSAWLDKKFNPLNFIVGISEFAEEKKGKNVYQVPVFKPFKSNAELDKAAMQQDKLFQEYLKAMKDKIPEAEIVKAEVEEEEDTTFTANPEWQKGGRKASKEEIIEDVKRDREISEGKKTVKSMTDVKELENTGDLPF